MPPLRVETFRVEDIIGTDIVNNGRAVFVRMKAEDSELRDIECALEIPAHLLQHFTPPTHGVFQFPKAHRVGHSNDHRGMVALEVDGGTPREAIYFFPNQQGLKLALDLKNDIMPRLTDQERIQAVAAESKVQPVPRPKLILPSGFR